MKVRTGFVSNSSSSSFVVVGKVVSFSEFKKLTGVNAKKIYKEFEEYDFEVELSDAFKKTCSNADYEVIPFGNIEEFKEILMYYLVPNNPKEAVDIISKANETFGKGTVVEVVTQNSESGNYFGGD